MPLSPRDISLADLYVAYRKAKVEAYYEKTHLQALAFTEYEQNLHQRLVHLHRILLDKEADWSSDLSFLGGYAYVPKSIDTAAWDDGEDGHFAALDPLAEWRRRFERYRSKADAKLRLIILPSVNFQIISALWIIKVGHLYDDALNPSVCFANRLRRTWQRIEGESETGSSVNLSATGLFAPYFSAYREWREGGLKAMEEALSRGMDILAITMDIEQFYHRVSPRFLLRRRFLESIGLTLSTAERSFTRSLLNAIETWYRSTPDYIDRPEGAIPVGLSASKIIANVVLAEFDTAILNRVDPLYYGRYVDDIFLVFRDGSQLDCAGAVTEWMARTLGQMMVLRRNDHKANSLLLRLPYANDSELIFAGTKQKIFALSSEHGLDLVQHIREQIRVQSSEYRLLPEVPESGAEMASKSLLATSDASRHVDALRKADAMSVRRLGLSLLLRDIETYASDVPARSWRRLRNEFYGLVNRHALTPSGFFEFASYLPRVFGLMLACGDFDDAERFVRALSEVAELLLSTSTVGVGKQRDKFSLCMKQYAEALRQTALQAATRQMKNLDQRFLAVLRKLKILDSEIKVPSSAERLKHLVQQMLLADWGSQPYKEYWYLSQKNDENGPPVPKTIAVRRHLGGIRRFRSLAGDLKVPHWPALAFPTRPLRADEIPLVAPDVLLQPEVYRRAIMALRGARVRSTAQMDVKMVTPSSGDINEFVVPGKTRKKITVAITSFQTTEQQGIDAAKSRPDRSLIRYKSLNTLVNRILQEEARPDYIVFPELSIPLRWALRVARKLATNGVSLLAGVEYHRDRKSNTLRNDCLVSLVTSWPGYPSNVVRLQPKFVPAHNEQQLLKKLFPGRRSFFRPSGKLALPTLYVHRGFCFSILICSDLTNVSHRSALRGEIDALFVPEWNSDVKTFSSLVEAAAFDLHSFVVQVNNRLYGDSRVRVAAKDDFRRDVIQVKGGISDFYVLGAIDYAALRREQRAKVSKPIFKPTPIGYKMSDRRRKGAV